MRQEGNSSNSNNNQVPSGPSSIGPVSAILGDSNSLPGQPGIDDMHQHNMHAQNAQTLNFGDMY